MVDIIVLPMSLLDPQVYVIMAIFAQVEKVCQTLHPPSVGQATIVLWELPPP